MTRTDSFLTELVEGIAAVIIQTVPAIPYYYDASGAPYPSGKLGIYRDLIPEIAYPSVTVSAYETVEGADTNVSVQFRIAAKDPRELDAITADIRQCFHHRWGGTLAGIQSAYSIRESGTLLPQDGMGRGVRTENYTFRVNWPNPNHPA